MPEWMWLPLKMFFKQLFDYILCRLQNQHTIHTNTNIQIPVRSQNRWQKLKNQLTNYERICPPIVCKVLFLLFVTKLSEHVCKPLYYYTVGDQVKGLLLKQKGVKQALSHFCTYWKQSMKKLKEKSRSQSLQMP